jgi:hypothetical protein
MARRGLSAEHRRETSSATAEHELVDGERARYPSIAARISVVCTAPRAVAKVILR